MTKFYQAFSTVIVILLLAACGEDDPLPAPVPNFFTDPDIVEVGVPVMFDNLSTNAARYEWIFGDSSNISTEISPTVTFGNAGTVTVTLKAFTEDDQMVESVKEVVVRERILTGYFVNVFPNFNGTDPWDPGLAGAEQAADIFVQLTPIDPNNPSGIADGIYGNVPFGPFGNIVDPVANRIVLTDEDWSFVLFDFDGDDPAEINDDNVEFMAGVQFNPVQAGTFKNDNGDAGFVSVLLVDNEGNVFDVDFSFELQ